jgi:hypothetical protein
MRAGLRRSRQETGFAICLLLHVLEDAAGGQDPALRAHVSRLRLPAPLIECG